MAERGPGATAKPEALNKLKDILHKDYEDFVKELGELASDDKIIAAIRAGKRDGKLSDEKVKITKVSIPVKKLHPTQNEIDVDKSLKYQLKGENPGQLATILEGKDLILKAPIITLNNKYIIDGHHRWSQVYAMNPDATMVAMNMEIDEDPIEVLKAVQMAIAAKLGEVPTAKVEGHNLLKIKEKKLKNYVQDKIKDETLDVLAKEQKIELADKEYAADYIWDNVDSMQKTSQPAKGAPDRDVMPQTDDAEDKDGDWKDLLQQGVINFKEPVAAHESRQPLKHIMLFEQFKNRK